MGHGPTHHGLIWAGPQRAYMGWPMVGLAHPVPFNLSGRVGPAHGPRYRSPARPTYNWQAGPGQLQCRAGPARPTTVAGWARAGPRAQAHFAISSNGVNLLFVNVKKNKI